MRLWLCVARGKVAENESKNFWRAKFWPSVGQDYALVNEEESWNYLRNHALLIESRRVVSWSSCPRRRISDHWRGRNVLEPRAKVTLRRRQPCAKVTLRRRQSGLDATKIVVWMTVLHALKIGGVEGAMRWAWLIDEGVRVGGVMGALHWSKKGELSAPACLGGLSRWYI